MAKKYYEETDENIVCPHCSKEMEKVLGRKPIDFTTYANEVANSRVWDGVEKERI